MQLDYNQNSFSFEFTAISFINPDKNKYAYILEGFDKSWNYCNAKNRIASYTNLDPGTYVFRVKGSNNDGVWNEEGTSITVIIAAPFWRTWWFYIISIIAFCILISIIYYIRIRQMIAIQNIRNKIAFKVNNFIF